MQTAARRHVREIRHVLADRNPRPEQDGVRRPRGIGRVVDVQGVDADKASAPRDQQLAGLGGQKGVVAEVSLRSPVAREIGPEQDRPVSHLDAADLIRPDGTTRGGGVDHDGVEVGQPLDRERREVGRAAIAMNRGVDVGSRVAAEVKRSDEELRLAPVPLVRLVVVEDDLHLRLG